MDPKRLPEAEVRHFGPQNSHNPYEVRELSPMTNAQRLQKITDEQKRTSSTSLLPSGTTKPNHLNDTRRRIKYNHVD